MIDKLNGSIKALQKVSDLCNRINEINPKRNKDLDAIIKFCDDLVESYQEMIDGIMEDMHRESRGYKKGDLSNEIVN
jgi:hypothetical protein